MPLSIVVSKSGSGQSTVAPFNREKILSEKSMFSVADIPNTACRVKENTLQYLIPVCNVENSLVITQQSISWQTNAEGDNL